MTGECSRWCEDESRNGRALGEYEMTAQNSVGNQGKSEPLGGVQAWSADYPYIPREVFDYVHQIREQRVPCPLLTALQEHEEGTLEALDRLFRSAGGVLGLERGRLIDAADWVPHDHDPTRFDAMLAELRAVVFLHDLGFSGIQLIPSRGEKRADGTGQRGQIRYAFEVVCPSREVYRWPDHDRESRDLTKFIVDKFRQKRAQLDATADEENCGARLLIVVIIEETAAALLERPEYLANVLEPAWQELGKPQDTYLAILAKYRTDSCVFPPLRLPC